MVENGYENTKLIHHELKNGTDFVQLLYEVKIVGHFGGLNINNLLVTISSA